MITRSTAPKFTAVGLATALMLAVSVPAAEARGGRTAAAVGGFAAGAAVGSAIAGSRYYGPAYGRAYGPAYAYAPAPVYGPAYAQAPAYGTGYAAYAYAPGRDHVVAYDSAGNPIKASELGGFCTFGHQIGERC